MLDLGLDPRQRERLSVTAEVVQPPGELGATPLLSKPFPALLERDGVAVVIDGDMIVTRSLDAVLERAETGAVCTIADIPDQRDRWFAEWQALLDLPTPPRRQPYVNAGFVALSTDRWPDLLGRWLAGCRRLLGSDTMTRGGGYEQPFWAADQDVLNALLMSEVPADALEILPERAGPSPRLLHDVEILDPERLDCRLEGDRPYLLHYWGSPKPWERSAWTRVDGDAYVRLLPRVLLGDDVAIPVAPGELPSWLRQGPRGRLERRALGGVNRLARGLLAHLPEGTGERLGRLAR